MTDELDHDSELRALLRTADPAASLPPADPARVARLLEDTMSHDTLVPETTRQTGTRGRNPLTYLVAAAAALVIAGVAALALMGPLGGDATDPPPIAGGPETSAAPAPTVTRLSAPTEQPGRCMVPNARVLSQQTVAFEGVVESVDGNTVVLVPTTFYAGDRADRVEVAAPGEELTFLLGEVPFEEGGTYLVAANDGQVVLCGFSGPATPQLERLYSQAFGQ